MELTEDQTNEKYAEPCGHCLRNTLLPFENEFTCVSCGYNVIKQNHELSKNQRENKKLYQSIKIC